jgi:hypothetical protein
LEVGFHLLLLLLFYRSGSLEFVKLNVWTHFKFPRWNKLQWILRDLDWCLTYSTWRGGSNVSRHHWRTWGARGRFPLIRDSFLLIHELSDLSKQCSIAIALPWWISLLVLRGAVVPHNCLSNIPILFVGTHFCCNWELLIFYNSTTSGLARMGYKWPDKFNH